MEDHPKNIYVDLYGSLGFLKHLLGCLRTSSKKPDTLECLATLTRFNYNFIFFKGKFHSYVGILK